MVQGIGRLKCFATLRTLSISEHRFMQDRATSISARIKARDRDAIEVIAFCCSWHAALEPSPESCSHFKRERVPHNMLQVDDR